MAKRAAKEVVLEIKRVETDNLCLRFVGISPIIFNALSAKSLMDLWDPPVRGKKSAADLAERGAKHDPINEYRNAIHRLTGAETVCGFPAVGLKAAMATAALDMPGAKKAQIGRLVRVEGRHIVDKLEIYGLPEMLITSVRCQDVPDVRTRPIVREWAFEAKITYVKPLLTEQSTIDVLSAAGELVGLGDYRQEKGKGSYGQFRVVSADDPDFLRIKKAGGAAAQEEALRCPRCYDVDTEDMFAMWCSEYRRRRNKDYLEVCGAT